MRIKPIPLACLSLVIGVGIGFGVLNLQRFVARELLGLLNDQAQEIGNYHIQWGEASLTLIPLMATAHNVSLTDDKGERLTFKKLEASIGLSQIFSHHVDLNELRMYGGDADGVLEHSATFKYIDHLLTPNSSQKPGERPSDWKVDLHALTLLPSLIHESFFGVPFEGMSSTLTIVKSGADSYHIRAAIPEIRRVTSGPTRFSGSATAEMEINDDRLTFTSFLVHLPGVEVSTGGSVALTPDGSISTLSKADIDLSRLLLPSPFSAQGNLAAEISVGGSPKNPTVNGSTSATSPIELLTRHTNTTFDTLKLGFDGDPRKEEYEFIVDELRGEDIVISAKRPLFISAGRIDGALQIDSPRFHLFDQVLKDVSASVEISGQPTDVRFDSTVHTSLPIIGPVTATIIADTQGLLFDLSAQSDRIQSHGKLLFEAVPRLAEASIQIGMDGPGNSHINGQAHLEGPFLHDQLKGEMHLNMDRQDQDLLDVDATLSQGKFHVLAGDDKKTVRIVADDLIGDTRPGTVSLTTNGFDYTDFLTGNTQSCSTLTSEGMLAFPQQFNALPSGKLQISRIGIGCRPFLLQNRNAFDVEFSPTGITVPPTVFASEQGEITGKFDWRLGAAERPDVVNADVKGSLELKNILPLVPGLEDLSGVLTVDASLSGNSAEPVYQGKISLKDGAFLAANASIKGDSFAGSLLLNGESAQLEAFKGKVNEGTVTAAGGFTLPDEKGSVTINATGVTFAPSTTSNFTVQSSVTAQLDPVRIKGEVKLSQGSIEENVELLNLLQANGDRRSINELLRQTLSNLPFETDLTFSGPRTLTVNSNLVSTDLSVAGTVQSSKAAQKFTANLDTDSGWILLGDKRFDIRSATVSFRDERSEPSISVQAEALIRTREGDVALIRAVVSGTLSAPEVRFLSDRGLRQRDIITLLTAGTGLLNEGRFGTLQQDFSIEPLEFFDDDVLFGLAGWFKRLSRIDSLAFEPAFNPQRGTIDPTIVASKRLFGKFTLAARSAFSAGNPDDTLELRYPLTRAFEARVLTQSVATQNNNAVEGLILYQASAPARSDTLVQVDSDSRWLSERLSLALEQGFGQRLRESEVDRVRTRTYEFLKNEGYYQPTVTVGCVIARKRNPAIVTDSFSICSEIRVTVHEGEQATVKSRVVITDRPIDVELKQKLASALARLRNPTTTRIAGTQRMLIQELRRDGYPQARCQMDLDTAARRISARVVLGSRIELNFAGNTLGTAEDFLDSVKYLNYPGTFGSNFVSLLLEGMERFYSDKGYPLATFYTSQSLRKPSATQTEQDPVTVVDITIEEGPKRVSEEPVLEGLETINEEQLIGWIKDLNPDSAREIFSSKTFSHKQSGDISSLVEKVMQAHGYPDAKVIVQYKNLSSGTIVPYLNIHEGAREAELNVRVDSLPKGIVVDLPATIFAGQAEEVSAELTDKLKRAGYLNGAVEVQMTPPGNSVTFRLQPGTRSVIGDISFDYVGEVSKPTLEKSLRLKKGDPWDQASFEEAQRRLFGLGLFKKVSLEATDGVLDNTVEDLSVILEPQQPQIITLGIGANSEYGAHLQAAYLDRGIFLDGRTISGQMDSYFGVNDGQITKGVLSAAYNDPHLLDSELGYVSEVRFQKLNQETLPFDLDRITLSNYLHQSWDEGTLGGGLTATFGHSLLFEDLTNVDPGAILDPSLDSNRNRLSLLSSTVGFDARDNALMPLSGWAASLTNQLSSEVIGSEANYYIADGRISLIAPLGDESRFSVASATRGAIGIAYGADDTLPLSQRFFLGGRNSVRGFKENSLGPRSADGNTVQGGDLLGVQNFELRYLATEGVQLDTFLDLGGLFQQDKSFEIRDIRRSVGVGTRYLSPIGPIGFDLGFPLDERPGESSVRFHFTIGSNF